jgi:carbamoylphosphate synthase large subunit
MAVAVKKKFTKFRPFIYSRHPTHGVLRGNEFPLLNFRAVVRLGSTTDARDSVSNGGQRVEVNTIQAVRNSASKLLMKRKFTEAGVKTAKWCEGNEAFDIVERGIQFRIGQNDREDFNGIEFPLVAKHIHGSRGTGNYLLKNQEELKQWMRGKTLANYIFEKFYNYSREYRLHVSENGCFYTCRKVIKNETPEDQRWFRNDSNSNWIVEENELFDKPTNWDVIVAECVKALKAVGLDVGAFDVKVQSATKSNGRRREQVEFIILESNSAPSFGEITAKKYMEELPKILKAKFAKLNG